MRFCRTLLTTALLAGFIPGARAELVDGITAIVHDSIITHQQVQNYVESVFEDLRGRSSVDNEKDRAKVVEEAVETLLDNQLILREFSTAGYNVPDAIIDEQMESSIRANYPDRVTFIKTLQAEGKTLEQFRKRYRDNLIISEMRYKNVSGEVIISPHKVEDYYVQHTNNFRVEPEVKLRMIVLNKSNNEEPGQSRKLAEEVLGKINEGAAFAEMASLYSQGVQRNQGGDWGWFEVSKLRKELSDVATSLKAGDHSGVIETPEACYLMLVEDKRPAHIRPLNEVRDEIETTLLKAEHDRLQKQWIERLKKKTFIRYF